MQIRKHQKDINSKILFSMHGSRKKKIQPKASQISRCLQHLLVPAKNIFIQGRKKGMTATLPFANKNYSAIIFHLSHSVGVAWSLFFLLLWQISLRFTSFVKCIVCRGVSGHRFPIHNVTAIEILPVSTLTSCQFHIAEAGQISAKRPNKPLNKVHLKTLPIRPDLIWKKSETNV